MRWWLVSGNEIQPPYHMDRWILSLIRLIIIFYLRPFSSDGSSYSLKRQSAFLASIIPPSKLFKCFYLCDNGNIIFERKNTLRPPQVIFLVFREREREFGIRNRSNKWLIVYFKSLTTKFALEFAISSVRWSARNRQRSEQLAATLRPIFRQNEFLMCELLAHNNEPFYHNFIIIYGLWHALFHVSRTPNTSQILIRFARMSI